MFDLQQIAEGRRCGFVEGWRILKIWRLYLKFEITSGIQGEVSEILDLLIEREKRERREREDQMLFCEMCEH
ncbi:hypothetical protein HanPSC8_Chr04g0152451 [Helianthus annuus]|nr:hypothetical protein HanPSC8_Chr04g0152451 [Helianthus annuus]